MKFREKKTSSHILLHLKLWQNHTVHTCMERCGYWETRGKLFENPTLQKDDRSSKYQYHCIYWIRISVVYVLHTHMHQHTFCPSQVLSTYLNALIFCATHFAFYYWAHVENHHENFGLSVCEFFPQSFPDNQHSITQEMKEKSIFNIISNNIMLKQFRIFCRIKYREYKKLMYWTY